MAEMLCTKSDSELLLSNCEAGKQALRQLTKLVGKEAAWVILCHLVFALLLLLQQRHDLVVGIRRHSFV